MSTDPVSPAVPDELHGFRPFPADGKRVTNEQIDELRDLEGL
jgi:hypothetical protein